jgi:Tfp pilus assembly protein PilX
METAIGLVCFVLMMLAQVAGVIAVHRSQQQTREERETSNYRAPVRSFRLSDAAGSALPAL